MNDYPWMRKRIAELESALAAEKEARQEAESTAINGFPNQLARISELNAKLATSEAARQEAERQLTRARSLLESGLATINGLVDQQAMSDEFWEVAATDIAYFLANNDAPTIDDEQLATARAEGRREGLEEAAEVADNYPNDGGVSVSETAEEIAEMIRELAGGKGSGDAAKV